MNGRVDSARLDRGSAPRMNTSELVMTTVAGEIAHPADRADPHRIGQDGVLRILPGTGGIKPGLRVGDLCIGLAGDHLEPGVAIRNYRTYPGKVKDAFNLALNTYSCVGNRARVISGPCAGAAGVVTGKHGGVNHVLLDFSEPVLRRLRIGDRIQVYALGAGLRLPDFPDVSLFNCDPGLLRRWGVCANSGTLAVPVTHRLPARVMGSGLGHGSVQRGDYDIQLFDPVFTRKYALNRLRFGDLIAIENADVRHGRAFHSGFVTFGVVVHGDSTVSGHGPGVVSLICGPQRYCRALKNRMANLAVVLGIREAAAPRPRATLIQKHPLRLCQVCGWESSHQYTSRRESGT
jgi:hypothetical protein